MKSELLDPYGRLIYREELEFEVPGSYSDNDAEVKFEITQPKKCFLSEIKPRNSKIKARFTQLLVGVSATTTAESKRCFSLCVAEQPAGTCCELQPLTATCNHTVLQPDQDKTFDRIRPCTSSVWLPR